MRSSIAIPILLGAGAIAHPHFKLNNPLAHVHHKRQNPVEVITTTIGGEVVIEDIYVTTMEGPAPSPAAAAVAAPEKLAVAPVQHKEEQHHQPSITPAPSTTPPPSSTPPASTPTPSQVAAPAQQAAGGNDGAPKSGGKSILESANHFRSLMGYPAFTYSSTLQANSAKTNNDNGANSMTHELNPGSFAQCIAQVDNTSGGEGYTSFELTYLAWLCEIDDARLGDACQAMEKATNMIVNKADPGHAQILRNPQYSQIGCNYLTSTEHHADYAGMYTCDFK